MDWLIDQLESDAIEVRYAAQQQIASLGTSVIELLISAVRANAGAKSWRAAKLLPQIDVFQAVEPLIEALCCGDLILRQTAAQLLGETGDLRAVAPLIVALDDPAITVRVWAIESLGKLGDPRALGPLIDKLWTADSPTIRHTIIHALGELGDPRALNVVLPFVDDANHHVRNNAARARDKLQASRVETRTTRAQRIGH